MENSSDTPAGTTSVRSGKSWHLYLTVLLFSGAIYLGCIVSPPSLMDDADAVQAQISRNMLASGDWVTARLDGLSYLEKAPLVYRVIAGSYKIFGTRDWSARIPIALSAIALAWLTAAFGISAFRRRAGFYAGLCMGTCVGLPSSRISVCLVIPVGYVANSLPLTPGGLGVGETEFGALFDLAGLDRGAHALLSWRVWSAFLSISGLIFYLGGLGRSMFQAEAP
jgi:Dolichyl-phosphate-mannose-protein mannosyltransferase